MAFKCIAIVLYLLGGIVLGNITVFVLVVIIMAMDFWFTKNIAGRKLVGLKWDAVFDDDGKQEWVFDSRDEKNNNNKDSSVFWLALV
jgi:hypothetical protein